MRRLLLVLAAVVIAAPLSVGSKPGKRGRKGKPKFDADELKELIEQQKAEAPGYFRWYESITTSRAQLKITRIDTSEAPTLKLHFSILTVGENGILQQFEDSEKIKTLTVMTASGEEKRPKPLVKLVDGVQPEIPEDMPAEERPPITEMMAMEDAEVPMDVVVVAAGHSGYKDVEQLEERHHEGVRSLLSKLSVAHMNLVWYGPMLYTYRTYEGAEGELSRYDENLSQCDVARLKYMVESQEEQEDGEDPLAPPPCGLHEGQSGAMATAVDRMRFRGKHARLFGIDRSGINPCSEQGIASTAIQQYELDDLEEKTMDAGAFEEALRMIVQYGRPGSRKAIVVIGDGRDGFVDEDLVCRNLFTSSPQHCAGAAGETRGRKGRQMIQDCVQRKLDERGTDVQTRWRERAVHWIALLRAADIRVFSIAYAMTRGDKSAVSYKFERQRLELLSLKTGGTYREVINPRDIPDVAAATINELMNERVLTIGGVLKPAQNYRISLKAKISVPVMKRDGEIKYQNATIRSPEYDFETPFIGEGFSYWFKEKNKWLKNKVGTVLYWVIIVVIILLVLLVLWLLFKMFKALFKKIFGAVAKKGKAAGKKAVKG